MFLFHMDVSLTLSPLSTLSNKAIKKKCPQVRKEKENKKQEEESQYSEIFVVVKAHQGTETQAM